MSEDLEITIIDYQQALDDAYKKGRESFLDDFGNATIPLSEAYQRGIKKVVDFIETMQPLEFNGMWQAKLKDWGIRGVNNVDIR